MPSAINGWIPRGGKRLERRVLRRTRRIGSSLVAALGRQGEMERAREIFQGAGSSPQEELLNAWGYALHLHGRDAEAIPVLRQSLALRPDQEEVRALLDRIDTPVR